MSALFAGLAFFFASFSAVKIHTVWLMGDNVKWLIQLALASVAFGVAFEFALLTVEALS